MNINYAQLDAVFSLCVNELKEQDLPSSMKKRWARALEKARTRLIEQPFFALQPERLLMVSVPSDATVEIGCRLYEANESACRRVDKTGLC